MNIYFYELPIGTIGIAGDNNAISRFFFGNKNTFGYSVKETLILKEAALQLREYFDRKRVKFDLPLSYHGTDFQISVWNALLEIPYGETRSYKEVAEIIRNPNACRAVGMANHRNPLAIFIPCHRVVEHNGGLGGYAGGLGVKQHLLDLEKN